MSCILKFRLLKISLETLDALSTAERRQKVAAKHDGMYEIPPLFKAFSFATYMGWSVFVAKGTAVRLRPSQWNKMAKTGLRLFYLCK